MTEIGIAMSKKAVVAVFIASESCSARNCPNDETCGYVLEPSRVNRQNDGEQRIPKH